MTRHSDYGRRQFLQTTAAATLLGGGVVGASATPGRGGGFPPAGITEWGPSVTLGDGSARTFTTATPSGNPKYQGVLFDRAAFEGLPSAADLANAPAGVYDDKYGPEGQALPIHHRYSLEFFVPLPEAAATPFTFLGLNWNPNGHPPGPVWGVPHFDIHFHTPPAGSVDAITGPAAPDYDVPARYVPEGYARGPVVEERVITDMGEHLADTTAPEFSGGTFTNTLIWGLGDPDGDGTAEHTFVEPMITRAFLRDHSGIDRREIAQPAAYARDGTLPMAYSVRDVPSRDAVAVVLEDFEAVDGED